MVRPRVASKATQHRFLKLRANRFHDGVLFWKAACLEFGINKFAVDADFESATAGRNQLERANALLEFQKLFRQTDGMRFVVSDRAVFDDDFRAH